MMTGPASTPIVDEIDVRQIVTGFVWSLHRDTLKIGAEAALYHLAVGLMATQIHPSRDVRQAFRGGQGVACIE